MVSFNVQGFRISKIDRGLFWVGCMYAFLLYTGAVQDLLGRCAGSD